MISPPFRFPRKLTDGQRKAADVHDGGVEVEDASGKSVLMSLEVFRDMMGVGTDREFQESVWPDGKSSPEGRG